MNKVSIILMGCILATGCSANDQKKVSKNINIQQVIQDKTYSLKNTLPGSEITIIFGKDGRVMGKSGVNNYFSTYKINGNHIEIGQCASTRMAGSNDLMQQEQKFLKQLSESEIIKEKSDGGIQLINKSGDILEFEKK